MNTTQPNIKERIQATQKLQSESNYQKRNLKEERPPTKTLPNRKHDSNSDHETYHHENYVIPSKTKTTEHH